MLQLRIPGIVTTYISGTWTILMSGVTRVLAGKQNPNPNERADFETRLFMQAGILAVYFLSAVLTGWLLRYEPSGVGALPAACVLAVSVYGLIRG
jgi:hypothetical protein